MLTAGELRRMAQQLELADEIPGRGQSQPARDAFWVAVNRAVLTTPSGDYGRLARLHEAQARVLHAEERPYIHLQELMFAEDLEALAAIDRGFSGRVAIIGGECCPACGRDKRTQVTFGDERRLRRLPHRECAKGWCNCLYVGAPVT